MYRSLQYIVQCWWVKHSVVHHSQQYLVSEWSGRNVIVRVMVRVRIRARAREWNFSLFFFFVCVKM